MSKLLLDEQPLMVMPKLATKIGLNEAIVLQQIHYWNEINKKANNNFRDGYHWTFNSIEEGWQEQFPFWSSKTIQRTMNNLEKMKLVVTGNYNKLKIDRTKWYRIDYIVLKTLEESPFGQIDQKNMTDWLNHLDKLRLPLPENNTENSTKIKNKNRGQNSVADRIDFSAYVMILDDDDFTQLNRDQLEALADFVSLYEEYRGERHPKLTFEQWEKSREEMLYVVDNSMGKDFDLDLEDEVDLMRSYFETDYKEGCNYSILHYISGDLRAIRYYDVIH
ncbi:hypothetical protein [Bacillus weihaiensis]|uniref:Replication protein n=1 Tax=Bacillus weihaiensis TaxID=1547283 RepID=A0A1L3MY28_9BACI|nr:hypothetical protein [Bacillus weihaiensis]APH07200.1 hypothetical protein A9C19_20650 [Bacillus weihaiensis]